MRDRQVVHADDRSTVSLLDHSIFIDLPGDAERQAGSGVGRDASDVRQMRQWAIEQLVRCEGVAVVVADASGLTMAGSRRLQLAAAARRTPVHVLLVRPPFEMKALTAASTRWTVEVCAPSVRLSAAPSALPTHPHDRSAALAAADRPVWSARLVRCKSSLHGSLSPASRRRVAATLCAVGDASESRADRCGAAAPMWSAAKANGEATSALAAADELVIGIVVAPVLTGGP